MTQEYHGQSTGITSEPYSVMEYRAVGKISEEGRPGEIGLKKGVTLNRRLKGREAGAVAQSVQGSFRAVIVVSLLVVLPATTLILCHFLNVVLHPGQLVKHFPYAATHILPVSTGIVEEKPRTLVPQSSGLLSVRNIVAFPDVVMLLVAAEDGARNLPGKENLECLFGEKYRTGVRTIEWKDDNKSIVAVRCHHPSQSLRDTNKIATLVFRDSNFILHSSAQYLTNSSWTPLVYETVTLADSVLLFVKGLADSHGRPSNYSTSLHKLTCRFGSDGSTSTRVIGMAQEVVRCQLPSNNGSGYGYLQGDRVSLFVEKIGVLPSVAYFGMTRANQIMKPRKLFRVCSCTMLWNQARFLQEWVMYHGLIGVDRWFLYDNNSEDEIESVLAGLTEHYNVSRHPWPWIKTQEAGFSHCALRARADCEWVLFTDVDEFVYPRKDLQSLMSRALSPTMTQEDGNPRQSHVLSQQEGYPKKSHFLSLQGFEESWKKSNKTVLQKLLERTLKKGEEVGKKRVGEVRLMCHNFGPSGLVRAPEDGVIAGYTCRMKWPQRHKSFLLLDAMDDSLLNVVHHFALREGYQEMAVHIRTAVINHYKFQAWEVFQAKFVRRVATYVVDWKEQTALSKDRAPGLGLQDLEPPDWPDRYCEELDFGLRNFTSNVFRHPLTQLMPWQLT